MIRVSSQMFSRATAELLVSSACFLGSCWDFTLDLGRRYMPPAEAIAENGCREPSCKAHSRRSSLCQPCLGTTCCRSA